MIESMGEQDQTRRDIAVRKDHLRMLAQSELQGVESLERWTLGALISVNGAAIVLIVPLPNIPSLFAIIFIFGIILAFVSIQFRQAAAYQSINLAVDYLRTDEDGWTVQRAGDIDWDNKRGNRHKRLKSAENISKYLSIFSFVSGCFLSIIFKALYI